ncbi:SPOR domain-containing protein [Chitinimonas taiwanensis]|uniref:SPOR domain-containing protein n=1 Tax=Chitinimonas taiwanensis TaxID=240412 RepID=UPI0035AEDDBF
MADAPISEELTALKKRARRRLVGAVALVLIALIVLWTVMDDQPPQSLVQESVAIVSSKPALAGTVQPDPVMPPAELPADQTEPSAPPVAPVQAPPAPAAVKPADAKPVSKPEPKSVEKPAEKPVEKPPVKPAPTAKDPAKLLDGLEDDLAKQAAKHVDKPTGKFFLQIGAFADATKASALQSKAKAAGVNVHTEAVKTEKGELTRLRAGPYASRDLAEQAHGKLAAAGVSSNIVGK